MRRKTWLGVSGFLGLLVHFVFPRPHIFGGFTNNGFDTTIARLDSINFTWSQVGELKKGRHAHNVIEIQGDILVIGGSEQIKTERCSYINGQIQCTLQEPDLFNYVAYPELLLVPSHYCN